MKHRDFSTGDIFPAGFVDALNEFLADYVGGTFHIDRLSTTQVQVVAGTAAIPEVSLAVGGAWRYITTTISATAPALGAGTYPIYVTASANNTAQEDAGTFNYAFAIKLGTTPTGTTTESLFRTVGSYTWDGAAITSVAQSVGASYGDNADATVAAPRSIGSGANQVVAGNDSRLTNSRAPGGAASGDLAGTYPGPTLASLAAQASGYSTGGVVRSGKSIIATSEVRTNTAYGLMTTPDRVQSIVLPTDGLIFVLFEAQWAESVQNTANAAIFIGANQLQVGRNIGGPAPTFATFGTTSIVNAFTRLVSSPLGLVSTAATGTSVAADVTTGQSVGGANLADGSFPGVNYDYAMFVGGNRHTWGTTDGGIGSAVQIQAAAGTYDISVQFKSTSGSVTARSRRLWVWTRGF